MVRWGDGMMGRSVPRLHPVVVGRVASEASVLPVPPLLGLVLPDVWSHLVSHASQHVGRCLRGNDQRLHHCRRDLAQDLANGPRDPSALVLAGRGLVNGVSSVCNALEGAAERGAVTGRKTPRYPRTHTQWIYSTRFSADQNQKYLLWR